MVPIWLVAIFIATVWAALLAGFVAGAWWKATCIEVIDHDELPAPPLAPMDIRSSTDIRQPWQRGVQWPPKPAPASVWLKPRKP